MRTTNLIGVVIAIPLGIGILSLCLGDKFGWVLIASSILVVIIVTLRFIKEENK